MKIENCETRPGLIAALTDPEYGTISKPYANHTIPGTIPAYQYDIGARGLSYMDNDFQNDGDGGYNDMVDEMTEETLKTVMMTQIFHLLLVGLEVGENLAILFKISRLELMKSLSALLLHLQVVFFMHKLMVKIWGY